jgi:hypothetical protein
MSETTDKIDELREHYGDLFADDEGLTAFIIGRWHAAVLGHDLPAGWEFKDAEDVTNRELKSYFREQRKIAAGRKEDESTSLWEVREDAVVAAMKAGWFTRTPLASPAEVETLHPTVLTRVRNAVEAFYTAVTTVNPT